MRFVISLYYYRFRNTPPFLRREELNFIVVRFIILQIDNPLFMGYI